MTANQISVTVSIACAMFAAGMGYGGHAERQQIATTCVPQGNEKLVSVSQTAEGVTCVFSQTYAKARRSRRAS